MAPQAAAATPAGAPVAAPGDDAQLPVGGTAPTGVAGPGSPPTVSAGPGAGPQRVVDLSFNVGSSDKLYLAWQAIGNLADMAGRLAISVHAESEAGFDKSKLQNGVLEPLREADLIE